MKNKKLKADLITAFKIAMILFIIIGTPLYYKYQEHKKFIRYMDCMNIEIYSSRPEISNNYCLNKLK